MSNRAHATLQHAIQYPSGHLDRFASFGPAFEMEAPNADQPSTPEPATITQIPSNLADQTTFNARRFITGGRAIFTLQGLHTRYTYRVNRSDPDAQGNTVLFLAILIGQDNDTDYAYLGILDERSGEVRLTRKSRYTVDAGPVKAARWALSRIFRGVSIEPATLYHEGKCGRCGRTLTVPESITSGFGPECITKI